MLWIVAVGCSLSGPGTDLADPPDSLTSGSTDSTNSTADSSSTTADGVDRATTVAGEGDGEQSACSRLAVDSEARVERAELVETSGLAASSQHTDTLWAHNDSGDAAAVFALGLDGGDRGRFVLDGVDAVDIEDMALANGRIHLADIGDNGRKRSTVAVHIFDEPDPTTGSAAEGRVTDVTSITAVYPDGPTDAEGLLVDPLTGQIVIFSKDHQNVDGPTRIYSLPTDGGPGTVEMELLGTVDVTAFNSRSTEFSLNGVLFPGLVTAADISADGTLIALRTYGTVWLFPRQADQTVFEALGGVPCEGGTAAETQGEAVAFLPARPSADGVITVDYVTIGEGGNRPVNRVTVELHGP